MITLTDWAQAMAQMTDADKSLTWDVLAQSYDTTNPCAVIA
ncbi:hypothetical protein [Mycolicibacterium mucogenicum]|nr:hypothetical protein [Mycolicibacterium mucogenicum]KAB7761793.1 hypothetical protein MMUC44124_01185 [Mycolicibacterium mucogenicum DSM 44124]